MHTCCVAIGCLVSGLCCLGSGVSYFQLAREALLFLYINPIVLND
jgi:hypothetical protein